MNPSPISPPVSSKPAGCSRGCLVALLIAGGLMLLTGLVAAVALWKAASSEEGQKVMKAIGKGASLASKGINGPGAQEVRNAGCPEAFVLDMAEMIELIGIFRDGGAPEDLGVGVMVTCQGTFGTLPDCADVAKAYLTAKDLPPGEFVVMVKTKNQKKEQCARRFSATGEDLGDFKK
jgi:hypothetical protein